MKVLHAGPDPEPIVMRNTGADRKAGLHLSDITKRMVFERDKRLNPDSPIDAMVLERGFTWEKVLELALAERHERPGYRPEQIQEDGIWMSPDWVRPDGDIQLEEWKATKKSNKTNTFDSISWTWLPNIKSYVRAMLKRKLIRRAAARIRVWFINGDYSFESKTSDFHLLNDYWRYDLEFDKRELEENWQSILSHGRKYGLLKGDPEETWASKQSPTTRKRSSEAPPPSRKTGRLLTYPSTKTSPKPRSAS